MSDLLDKLNLLVRSRVNSLLSNGADRLATSLPKGQLNNASDHVSELRQRIEQALLVEDKMQQQIDQLQQQAASASQQADQALQRQDEASARTLIQQQRRQEQQASMIQAELEQHKHATSQLIERVNELDARASDARRLPQEGQPAPSGVAEQKSADSTPGIPIKVRIQNADKPSEDHEEIDLAQRRARLSKPE